MGAEEGTDADFARAERDAGGPPDVRLNRPATVPDEDRAGSPRPTPVARPNDDQAHNGAAPLAGLPLSSRQAKPAADGAKGPGKAAAWAAASSSIPKLTAVPAAKAHPPTEEDFEDESAARTTGSLDDDDVAGAARSDVGPGEGGLRPLDEPWHVVLIERIATERKLQVLIGLAVVLVICTLVFWPHTGTSVSVKAIKLHPDGYEGQTVRVSGVVGEVFPVGQGYVYSLQQGRDTITVFARGHVPVTKQHVTVIGQVSTGYMDGRPRTAILEGDNP